MIGTQFWLKKKNPSKPPIKLFQARQIMNHHIALYRKEIALLTIRPQLGHDFVLIIIRFFWYFVLRIKSEQKASGCGG